MDGNSWRYHWLKTLWPVMNCWQLRALAHPHYFIWIYSCQHRREWLKLTVLIPVIVFTITRFIPFSEPYKKTYASVSQWHLLIIKCLWIYGQFMTKSICCKAAQSNALTELNHWLCSMLSCCSTIYSAIKSCKYTIYLHQPWKMHNKPLFKHQNSDRQT